MLEKTVWDDARVAELRRHWATGDSAAVIGGAMNLTRNAVLGKAHRLGLELRTRNVTGRSIQRAPAKNPNLSRSRTRVARIIRTNGNSNAMRVVSTVIVEQMRLRCVEIVPLNLTLAEINEDQCRYIAGEDYLYCGHPKMAGSSYCTPHHHLVWEKPRTPNDKYFRRVA